MDLRSLLGPSFTGTDLGSELVRSKRRTRPGERTHSGECPAEPEIVVAVPLDQVAGRTWPHDLWGLIRRHECLADDPGNQVGLQEGQEVISFYNPGVIEMSAHPFLLLRRYQRV